MIWVRSRIDSAFFLSLSLSRSGNFLDIGAPNKLDQRECRFGVCNFSFWLISLLSDRRENIRQRLRLEWDRLATLISSISGSTFPLYADNIVGLVSGIIKISSVCNVNEFIKCSSILQLYLAGGWNAWNNAFKYGVHILIILSSRGIVSWTFMKTIVESLSALMPFESISFMNEFAKESKIIIGGNIFSKVL